MASGIKKHPLANILLLSPADRHSFQRSDRSGKGHQFENDLKNGNKESSFIGESTVH